MFHLAFACLAVLSANNGQAIVVGAMLGVAFARHQQLQDAANNQATISDAAVVQRVYQICKQGTYSPRCTVFVLGSWQAFSAGVVTNNNHEAHCSSYRCI
jgi:hypothetical protein